MVEACHNPAIGLGSQVDEGDATSMFSYFKNVTKKQRERERENVSEPSCPPSAPSWSVALPSRITMTNEALSCREHRYGEQTQADFQENWELKKHAQSIFELFKTMCRFVDLLLSAYQSDRA